MRSLREANAEQLDRLQRNVQQMADFMLGKGPVNIGGELRRAVEDGIRAEYESLIRTKDAEISALKEQIRDKISGMLPNLWTDPMPYAIPAMPVEPSDAELVFGKK